MIATFPQTSSLVDSRLIIRLLLCLAGLLTSVNSPAFFDLSIKKTTSNAWHAEGLGISFNTAPDGREQLQLKLDNLSYLGQHQMADISLHCDSYILNLSRLECQQGRFTAFHDQLKSVEGQIYLSYDISSGALKLEINKLRLADSIWQARLSYDRENWSARLSSEAVDLPVLSDQLRSRFPVLQAYKLSAGQMQVVADISGRAERIERANIQTNIQLLDLAAVDGLSSTQTEKLGLTLGLSLERFATTPEGQQGWRISASLSLTEGLAYLEPGFSVGEVIPGFYLELQARPVNLDVMLNWVPEQQQIMVQSLKFNHQGVMQVDSHGLIQLGVSPLLSDMHFAVEAPSLQEVYAQWLQPLLLDTTFNLMQTSGGLQANVRVQDNQLTDVAMSFVEVYVEDEQGRFNLYGLDGDFLLSSALYPGYSQLSWQGAGIYKLDLGATELHLQSSRGQIKLDRPADIPVLDGVFKIDALELDNPGEEEMHFYLDGILTPVSLESFSQAMGWPIMAGKLSGIIPGLRYANHRISMDGNLLVRAFEGTIPIRGLEVTELFGQVPRLEADIDIHRLNLETLTSTFSFGKITGLLEGYIHDLKLEAWQPVSFTASFTNPEDDDSPHRISRRAVDDLTSIGGGIPTLGLSSRFIKVFDEFGYGELGLSCRLQAGVCEMGGVSDSADSYEILTHGLFPPWIEIKGFNRQVDWSVLVERLRDIMRGEAPVIQ